MLNVKKGPDHGRAFTRQVLTVAAESSWFKYLFFHMFSKRLKKDNAELATIYIALSCERTQMILFINKR